MTALAWAVKDSLLRYVRGMPDGRVELTGVTEQDGLFLFPATDAGPGRFTGSITLLGHHGMMRVVIADPQITPTSEGATLSIADPDDPELRLVFARIARFDGRRATGTVLTDDGADLFFGPYGDGTALDDPRVVD